MNKRNRVRKRQAKLERKRIKRDANRKRLRIANQYEVNLAVYKLKVKQGLKQTWRLTTAQCVAHDEKLFD